ncbi:hypothetical protein JRD95_00876 [Rickettsia parkeri]|nr:hypothetical protein JRD95_00876 [Rickettsia parkeri]
MLEFKSVVDLFETLPTEQKCIIILLIYVGLTELIVRIAVTKRFFIMWMERITNVRHVKSVLVSKLAQFLKIVRFL